MRFPLGGRTGQRELRQRRVDREGLERLVVAPQSIGEGARHLRSARQLGVAAKADRLGRVRRPEGHASAPRILDPIVQVERAVPDQRRREVVEPRPAVGDAQHVARVRPLGAEGEVVRARIVGESHFDVIAEAEAGPPGQLAAVLLRGVAGRYVEVRLRRRDHLDAADVAPLAQLELRRERDVGVEIGLAVLDRALRCVVEHQRAAAARIRRHRINAVELRNLLPAAAERQLADPAVSPHELLVAVADVLGARVEIPRTVRLDERIAEVREQQPVALVLVALVARRVAVHAREAAPDEEFARGRLEETARRVGRRGRGRLRRGLGRWLRRRLGGSLCECGPWRGEAEQGDRRDGESAHTEAPLTACRTGPTGGSSRGPASGSSRTICRTSGCSCWW